MIRRLTIDVALSIACLASPALSGSASGQTGVTWLATDIPSRAILASETPAQLDAPILPGSIMKIAALAAALESGVVTPATAIACPRTVRVAGHQLQCTHPDLHRPVRLEEALAHSCNAFVAAVAARISRADFDRTLLDLGLPPSDPAVPIAAAALGLEGARVTPRRLVEMMVKVSADPTPLTWRPATLAAIRRGLRGAAQSGTASALGAHHIQALAKTGTTIANGVAQGVVVGVTPADTPRTAFVVVASGVAGLDAAELAARRLEALRGATARTVRVGMARPDGTYDVSAMDLDAYVARVVAGESAAGSSAPALEALAITARTFALANRGRHGDAGFDVCDLTHCQVMRPPTAQTTRAAGATAGQVLLDRGRAAEVFLSASCGGRTAHPSEVWPRSADPAFLPSQEDDACAGGPEWTADLSVRDVMKALYSGGFRGDLLREMRVASRTSSGRVAVLALDGLTPPTVTGEDFRSLVGRSLGWQHLKSTAFDVRRTSGGFAFAGRGAGHGVGLCVLGSVQRAARGETTHAILAKYFPGLAVGAVPQAGTAIPNRSVVAFLPEQDRPDEPRIRALAVRLRDTLAAELQVTPPDRLTLRFHPTVESYQRASGREWFTAAATDGEETQLLPLSVLAKRGLVEPTLRHELVHILTRSALAQRPLWVQEGAAVYFSTAPSRRGALAADGGVNDSSGCPGDEELKRPASADALRAAYNRAASCFGRAMARGVSWRDVR